MKTTNVKPRSLNHTSAVSRRGPMYSDSLRHHEIPYSGLGGVPTRIGTGSKTDQSYSFLTTPIFGYASLDPIFRVVNQK
jgi:hypothetical protein